MKIEFGKTYGSGSVIVFSFEKNSLTKAAKDFDKKTKGSLTKAMANSKFEGKSGELLSVISPQGLDASRLICVGLGNRKNLNASVLEKTGAVIAKTLAGTKETSVTVIADDTAKISSAHIGFGLLLGTYRFETYKTEKTKDTLKKVTVITADVASARKEFEKLAAVAAGIYSARDFVSEPPNILTPAEFAKRTKTMMTKLGIKTEVYDEAALKRKKMNLMLAVAQASANRPQLVVMRYNGARSGTKVPIILVGKGLCFDSGGLCIKPGSSMAGMKQDMAGGAAVVGTLQSLALQKAPVNVIGIVPMVENSVSGNAYRPDDVITSYSGKTVEVINTDAEGRMVLADALWLAQEFKPRAVIDLATLTGAIKVALGSEYAGLFSNDDGLSDLLVKAGLKTGEKLWRFPMDKEYDDQLKSEIADFKHVGKGMAGSITAACFLQRFIKEGVKWAHLDIAGVAYADDRSKAISPSSATGFGVYLLNTLIRDSFMS